MTQFRIPMSGFLGAGAGLIVAGLIAGGVAASATPAAGSPKAESPTATMRETCIAMHAGMKSHEGAAMQMGGGMMNGAEGRTMPMGGGMMMNNKEMTPSMKGKHQSCMAMTHNGAPRRNHREPQQ